MQFNVISKVNVTVRTSKSMSRPQLTVMMGMDNISHYCILIDWHRRKPTLNRATLSYFICVLFVTRPFTGTILFLSCDLEVRPTFEKSLTLAITLKREEKGFYIVHVCSLSQASRMELSV